jgi:hypothetical protein
MHFKNLLFVLPFVLAIFFQSPSSGEQSSIETGTSLPLSANAKQLAEQLKLMPLIGRVQVLRQRSLPDNPTLESLATRQELADTRQKICETVLQTSLEIDAVQSEISLEKAKYDQAFRTYSARRDRMQALTNAASFCTNGALWTVAEALSIPTYNRPRYSVSSGAIGIMAGLVPTAFSLYALKLAPGKHFSGQETPNILSKMFDYPTNDQIEFPDSVWDFLNTVPAEGGTAATRRKWLIGIWVKNKDLASFRHSDSKKVLDKVIGAQSGSHTITLELLSTRLAMLEQLNALIFQMKRELLEIMQAVRKQ